MKIAYTHFLSEKQISERLKLLLKETAFEHKNLILNLEEKNLGEFNFTVNKRTVSGKFEIRNRNVTVYIKIPFYLFSLKRKLRKIIYKKMYQIFWYDKNKAYQFKTT